MTDPTNSGAADDACPVHEQIAALIDGPDFVPGINGAAGVPGSEAAEAAQDAPPATARPMGFDVAEINDSYALAIWGGKAVVVNEQPAGPVNDRVRVMSLDALQSWFGNRFTEIVGSDGKIKTVSWGKAWHSHPRRRSYAGVEFFPNPDGAAGTPGYMNFWRGFAVTPAAVEPERAAGSAYKTFRDHVLNNVCAGDASIFKYVFGWMAHIVQKPRERLGTAIVLRGLRGTGKSKVGEVLGSLIASHYFQVDEARYITGQFNAHMMGCLLLQADEAVWAGDKAAEGRLKGLITSEIQMIESKGVDPIRQRNYVRVIMTSNEGWVVPAGMDERRFCVLDVDARCAQNHEYFREMDEELNAGGREALLRDLLRFDLSQVDLWQIPKTRALLEQKRRSLEPIDEFWFNRLFDGATLTGGSSWPTCVPAADLYADYIKATSMMGIGRKRSAAEFGMRISKLVPGLRKTRPAIEVEPGVTRRVWCYELPPLDECRDALDGLFGQPNDWPALSPGEGGREKNDSDQVAPV